MKVQVWENGQKAREYEAQITYASPDGGVRLQWVQGDQTTQVQIGKAEWGEVVDGLNAKWARREASGEHADRSGDFLIVPVGHPEASH